MQSGEGGVGVIVRDCNGSMILTTWCVLFRCASAVDVKFTAMLRRPSSGLKVVSRIGDYRVGLLQSSFSHAKH